MPYYINPQIFDDLSDDDIDALCHCARVKMRPHEELFQKTQGLFDEKGHMYEEAMTILSFITYQQLKNNG